MTSDVATATPKPSEAVLSLTIEEPEARPFIEVDHQAYELAMPDDFSVTQLREMSAMWKFLLAMDERDGKVTKAEEEKYGEHLNKLFKWAAPTIPEELANHPNFGRSAKVAVIYNFFVEGAKRNPLLRKMNLASLLPLQDSSDSTAGTRQTG